MGFLSKSFFAGIGILIVAILLNLFASQFNIKTWNTLLTKDIRVHGMNVLSQISFIDAIFLFILYPFLLGAIAFLVFKNTPN